MDSNVKQPVLFPEIATPEEEEAFKDMESKQVGGTHYFNAIQPWTIIRSWNMNFWEGNILKYLLRHQGKGRKEDLEKAVHYLEYLIKYYDDIYPVPK